MSNIDLLYDVLDTLSDEEFEMFLADLEVEEEPIYESKKEQLKKALKTSRNPKLADEDKKKEIQEKLTKLRRRKEIQEKLTIARRKKQIQEKLEKIRADKKKVKESVSVDEKKEALKKQIQEKLESARKKKQIQERIKQLRNK